MSFQCSFTLDRSWVVARTPVGDDRDTRFADHHGLNHQDPLRGTYARQQQTYSQENILFDGFRTYSCPQWHHIRAMPREFGFYRIE